MKSLHSRLKMRNGLCLFLSAILFVQSGFAGTPQSSLTKADINATKKHFSSLGMGKSQTLAEWFEKAQKTLDPEMMNDLAYWVEQNRAEKIPALNIETRTDKSKNKYLIISFETENKKRTTFEMHRDDKGLYLTANKKTFRANDFKAFDSIAKAHQPSNNRLPKYAMNRPIISYQQLRDISKSDPQWGVKYLTEIRKLVTDMEKYQGAVLFKDEKRKGASVSIDFGFSTAEAQNFAQFTSAQDDCIVAGYLGVYDVKTGNCGKMGEKDANSTSDGEYTPEGKEFVKGLKEDYGLHLDNKCTGQGMTSCNPNLYCLQESGDPYCAPLVPATKTSIDVCESQAPIKSSDELKKCFENVDKKLNRDEKNKTEDLIKNSYLSKWNAACLRNDQTDKDVLKEIAGKRETPDAELAKIFQKKFDKVDNSGTDRNEHNRNACLAIYKRLSHLNDLYEDKVTETKESCEQKEKKWENGKCEDHANIIGDLKCNENPDTIWDSEKGKCVDACIVNGKKIACVQFGQKKDKKELASKPGDKSFSCTDTSDGYRNPILCILGVGVLAGIGLGIAGLFFPKRKTKVIFQSHPFGPDPNPTTLPTTQPTTEPCPGGECGKTHRGDGMK